MRGDHPSSEMATRRQRSRKTGTGSGLVQSGFITLGISLAR